jgi:DNA modification methylase
MVENAAPPANLAQIMQDNFLSEAYVNPFHVEYGAQARPIRESGVAYLKEQILQHGFLQFNAIIVNEIPSTEPQGYRIIEGAHRVTAVRRLLLDEAEDDPRLSAIQESVRTIKVSVYKPFDRLTELLVADLCNEEKSHTVPVTLYDNLAWLLAISKVALEVQYDEKGRVVFDFKKLYDILQARGCTRSKNTLRVYSYLLKYLYPASLDLLRYYNDVEGAEKAVSKKFFYTHVLCGNGRTASEAVQLGILQRLVNLSIGKYKCDASLTGKELGDFLCNAATAAEDRVETFEKDWREMAGDQFIKYDTDTISAIENVRGGEFDSDVATREPSVLRNALNRHQFDVDRRTEEREKEERENEEDDNDTSGLEDDDGGGGGDGVGSDSDAGTDSQSGDKRPRSDSASEEEEDTDSSLSKRLRPRGKGKGGDTETGDEVECEEHLLQSFSFYVKCGDWRDWYYKREEDTLRASLKGNVTLFVPDPPYGVLKNTNRDVLPPKEMDQVCEAARFFLSERGTIVIFCSWQQAQLWQTKLTENGFAVDKCLMTIVSHPRFSTRPGRSYWMRNVTQFAVVAHWPNHAEYMTNWDPMSDEDKKAIGLKYCMREYANVIDNYIPPSRGKRLLNDEGKPIRQEEKSVGLYRLLLHRYTEEGDYVMDLYGGTFASGVACGLEGRGYVGCEKDPFCFEPAYQRVVDTLDRRRAAGWVLSTQADHIHPDIPLERIQLRAPQDVLPLLEAGDFRKVADQLAEAQGLAIRTATVPQMGLGLFTINGRVRGEAIGYYWGYWTVGEPNLSDFTEEEQDRVTSTAKFVLAADGVTRIPLFCVGHSACPTSYANDPRNIKKRANCVLLEFGCTIRRKSSDGTDADPPFCQQLLLKTLRTIQPNEELYWVYGDDYGLPSLEEMMKDADEGAEQGDQGSEASKSSDAEDESGGADKGEDEHDSDSGSSQDGSDSGSSEHDDSGGGGTKAVWVARERKAKTKTNKNKTCCLLSS